MEHTLAIYLPVDRRHALATGTPLPVRMQGAALFADISGFTPLTEALTRELGPRRGAEELPRQLNLVYDALIREVDRYGGSVIGFAGDAITCWFDEDAGLRATACALAMQAAMRAFASVALPSGGTAFLAIKVAVAAGAVRRFLVGDPRVQLIDALAGATLTRMAAAEHMAEKGELLLDERTVYALGDVLDIQAWRTDERGARFAVVVGLRESVPPHAWPSLAPGTLSSEALRPWLLPTVYERLQAGQGEFLTELRPAVALFLRFGGIDYDADPDARQKLDAFVRWVQSLLVQYEGTLIQLTIGEKGSYLYAAFGAPIAHEDDARRAALTALVLRTPPEELGFITEIQIGLSRGTMRTGAYGGTTRRTYGSLGDEVNLAARLMQYARPGEIIASSRVQSATETLFTWQGLEEIRVKGKREPIPIFVLLGEAQSTTIHLAEPTYTLPMIGRQAELMLIEEKLALARRGQGQVVGITAEAGMGKSRLVAEGIRLAQAQGFTGYGGECQSYGTNTPYLVWQPIWRAFFGLAASATPAAQAAQVAHTIRELDPTLLPRLPLLAPVLGLPLPDNEVTRPFTPELRKAACEALLVDILKARARAQGALLLVLEDCHWMDAASHGLLEAIGHTIWNQPMLIVLAYRPPTLERLEAPRVSTLPYFTLLALTELSEPEAAHLLTSRLAHLYPQAERQPPAALVSQLTARAQGNPFYLEELLNYLHDQGLDPFEVEGVARLELPSSLHTLILSRIDRLSEPQKATLKAASIIGRLFRLAWLVGYYPALGAAAEVRRELEALRRLELTPLEQPEPERVYLFKHIITREAAYESLPFATRAQLHEQLARFLERQGESAIEGYLDLLAYHYTLSENRAKTGEYLRRAGEAAQAMYANAAAQAYYEQLLPLLTEPGAQVELHLRLGEVLTVVGAWDKAEAHCRAALALAQAAGQDTWQARSTFALGKLCRLRGQYEEAQRWLSEALVQWETTGEPGGRSQALAELGWVASSQGEDVRAVEYLEESRALCQASGDQVGLAETLMCWASVAMRQGNHADAQALYEESLVLWQALRDKQGMARALDGQAVVLCLEGHYAEALAPFEEGMALYREIGHKQGMARALNNRAYVLLQQGQDTEAMALWEECLALYREIGDKPGMARTLMNLSVGFIQQGHYAEGQTRGEEGLVLYREIGNKQGIAMTLLNLGIVAWWQANDATALQHYQACVRLAHELEFRIGVVIALVGLGAVALRQRRQAGFRLAAQLLGAGEALRAALAYSLEALEQAQYEEALAATRAVLSEEAFAAAWAEGQAMTLDEAVALALADLSDFEDGFAHR